MAKLTSLQKLEEMVRQQTENTNAFMDAAQKMVQSDHEKVDMIYNFLFVGKPDADPPVPSFIAMVKSMNDDICDAKAAMSKLIWALVGLILTGAAAFTIGVYNHVYLTQVVSK